MSLGEMWDEILATIMVSILHFVELIIILGLYALMGYGVWLALP
jgi:hypothetical protein